MADAASRHAAVEDFRFVSSLEDGSQRFLARAIQHGLKRGRRTPDDFLRHFPPSAIMRGLEHNAALRAFILASTTGIKERIAFRKSWEDAAADLKLAFDEGEASAEAIVELFPADECVRHLEARKLWQFLTEGEFWNADEPAAGVAREHIAYLLDSALEEELIDQRDVVEAITVQELANRMPREHLGALLRRALENGERRRNFTAVDMLATAGPHVLVECVPLPHIWNAVVRPRIAKRHGYEVSPSASAWSIPPDPTPQRNEREFPYQDDPDEITRVMPSPALPSKLSNDAPPKPVRDVTGKIPMRTSAQRPARENPVVDEQVGADVAMSKDAAKAG